MLSEKFEDFFFIWERIEGSLFIFIVGLGGILGIWWVKNFREVEEMSWGRGIK